MTARLRSYAAANTLHGTDATAMLALLLSLVSDTTSGDEASDGVDR